MTSASRSPSRGRSRTHSLLRGRSPTRSASPDRAPVSNHSRSPRRSLSPRSASRDRSPIRDRSPSPAAGRNGRRSPTPGSRSPSRSLSRSVRGRRESYSRSPSRRSSPDAPRSAKVSIHFSVSSSFPPLLDIDKQIVVEQLTKNVNEEHLYEIFGKYGRIKDLKLPMNPVCMYETAP
jgi:RNA-binding protein with serine-rich domain 1